MGISVRINRLLVFPLYLQLNIYIYILTLTLYFCMQFQKRKYAQFEWFPCGKKGYGLKLLEGVSQGQFLIEYVGEVSLSLSIVLS